MGRCFSPSLSASDIWPVVFIGDASLCSAAGSSSLFDVADRRAFGNDEKDACLGFAEQSSASSPAPVRRLRPPAAEEARPANVCRGDQLRAARQGFSQGQRNPPADRTRLPAVQGQSDVETATEILLHQMSRSSRRWSIVLRAGEGERDALRRSGFIVRWRVHSVQNILEKEKKLAEDQEKG